MDESIMIKVENWATAPAPTREPLPSFLRGLKPESLVDLAWTDPQLGVRDHAWWPAVDESPSLGEYEKYTTETLTADVENRRVIVTKAVEAWSQSEIDEDRRARTPASITMRQCRLQLLALNKLALVDGIIDAMPEPQKSAAKIEWEYAAAVERNSPLVENLGLALDLDGAEMDTLFMDAAKL
jgi:hypothetical protein